VIEPLPFAPLLAQVRALAREAGRAILATRIGAGDIEEKSDGSPVTQADLASERVILAGLEALRPRFPIVSEENDRERVDAASVSTYWLVDPLDGTKEFIKGLPEYTVNIALVHRGEPVLGVIHVPPVDRLYDAARGLGARRHDGDRGARSITPRRVDRPERAVVSRSHLSPETQRFVEVLKIRECLPAGSSLKLCAVAEGAADVYPRLGPIRLWDTAAGAAIAREAGCAVVDLHGQPLTYDLAAGLTHAGLLVCSPGACLDECLRALAAVRDVP
jgi:3'(2'), 5'-bisphosphate nucleotidase